MRTLIILPFVLLILVSTPSYSINLLCGSVGIGCEKVDSSEVLTRDGYVYKKFSTKKFTGKVIGQIQYTVVDGLREGEYTAFLESGALYQKGSYQNGKKSGRWETYFNNGQLMYFVNYRNGLLEGPVEHYYRNGQIQMKGSHQNDKHHGKWWIYDLDNIGVLKYERIYENGTITWENGKWIGGVLNQLLD